MSAAQEPLHRFLDPTSNVEARVWASSRPGHFNVTLCDLDSGCSLDTCRYHIPSEEQAVCLAKHWAGVGFTQ